MKKGQPFISVFVFLVPALLFFSVCSCQSDAVVSIKGSVQEIVFGKDGYTATIRTADNTYHAVISKTMLQSEYKELNTGDLVILTGDTFRLDNMLQIRVQRISY